MVRERKASKGEEEKVSNDGNMAWDQKMEEAESLHGEFGELEIDSLGCGSGRGWQR